MKLLWLDIETTGLDPRKDHVLEIASCVTDLSDPFLVLPSTTYEAVFRPNVKPEDVDPFVLEMHHKNGLWADCDRRGISLAEAEHAILATLPAAGVIVDREDKPVLAGFSVHFDLSFLRVHMPTLAKTLSHRVYDVSAVKLFCRSIGMPRPPKEEAHRAWLDVKESIGTAADCAKWVKEQRVAFEPVDLMTDEQRRRSVEANNPTTLGTVVTHVPGSMLGKPSPTGSAPEDP